MWCMHKNIFHSVKTSVRELTSVMKLSALSVLLVYISCILTNPVVTQISPKLLASQRLINELLDDVPICATKSLKAAKSPKVVIIGAGLSGIAAAAMLVESGFHDVSILEAENRTGGRILSIPFANGTIDMGGQWVHGETNNVVYDLVRDKFELGSTGVDLTFPTFLLSEGKPANQSQVLPLTKLAEKIMTSYSEQSRFSGSLGEYFIARFGTGLKSPEFAEIVPSLSQQVLDYYEKEINIWNGSRSWFDVSARGNTISSNNDGNQFMTWRDRGYKTVFDFLTVSGFVVCLFTWWVQRENSISQKKLPDPTKAIDIESKIQLNKKVLNIKLTSRPRKSSVDMTCADGSKISADIVIFTGSLGVLKRNHLTLFTPKLPPSHVKAIETLGYGTLGKIFLEFEKPFWPSDMNDWASYSLLWSKCDIEGLRGSDKEW